MSIIARKLKIEKQSSETDFNVPLISNNTIAELKLI